MALDPLEKCAKYYIMCRAPKEIAMLKRKIETRLEQSRKDCGKNVLLVASLTNEIGDREMFIKGAS